MLTVTPATDTEDQGRWDVYGSVERLSDRGIYGEAALEDPWII